MDLRQMLQDAFAQGQATPVQNLQHPSGSTGPLPKTLMEQVTGKAWPNINPEAYKPPAIIKPPAIKPPVTPPVKPPVKPSKPSDKPPVMLPFDPGIKPLAKAPWTIRDYFEKKEGGGWEDSQNKKPSLLPVNALKAYFERRENR